MLPLVYFMSMNKLGKFLWCEPALNILTRNHFLLSFLSTEIIINKEVQAGSLRHPQRDVNKEGILLRLRLRFYETPGSSSWTACLCYSPIDSTFPLPILLIKNHSKHRHKNTQRHFYFLRGIWIWQEKLNYWRSGLILKAISVSGESRKSTGWRRRRALKYFQT